MYKKLFLLGEIPDRRFNAGEKARNDVVSIIKSLDNTENIVFFHKGTNKIKVLKDIVKSFKSLSEKINNGDSVLIQYPYSPIFMYKYIYNKLDKLSLKKNFRKIVVIHDLNYLRHSSGKKNEFSDYTKKIEIETLNKFDKIICHNDFMRKKLIEDGIEDRKLISLQIFDYLIDNIEKKEINYSNKNIISIAGNLNPSKAGYINKLKTFDFKNIYFELFGPGYENDDENKEFMKYKGVAAPEELPSLLKGNYGLVWDGNSVEECDGDLGKYLQYNNPHKASLYLACGLPIIVWDKSAIAKFVKQNNIGIVLDKFENLEKVISNIDEQEYSNMINNVTMIRKKIINGKFLSDAVKKCIKGE